MQSDSIASLPAGVSVTHINQENMKKSAILLSKAAILSIFLILIASCVPFSSAARASALADVTASAPADAVEFCHKNADCKTTRCAPAGSFAFCLDGVCSCEVTEDSPVPVQIELTSSTPAVEPKVDRYGCPPSDCFEISCVDGCPERVHGRCQCVRIGPF